LLHLDLVRAAKTEEENYLLYLRKQEEARITDALDQKRIFNASIVQPATVPILPSGPQRSWILLLGGLLASFLSVGSAFVFEYLNPSFRTPDEVEEVLDVPVFAAMPNVGKGRRGSDYVS